MFQMNLEVHTVNMRHKLDHYRPANNLTVYQIGVYYSGIKLYNKLCLKIKCLSTNSKQFKVTLKEFHMTHTFCSVDDFILLRNY